MKKRLLWLTAFLVLLPAAVWAATTLISTFPSPLAVANGGTALASGTGGGVLCFTGSTTIASGSALTSNLPVIGGGSSACPTVGTRSGNTTEYANVSGSLTSGDGIKSDSSGNLVDSGAASGLTHFDLGYQSGTIPTTGLIMSTQIPVNMTIVAIVGTVGPTAAPTGTTIDVWEAPSGTACGSGTNLTNTTDFKADGSTATDQTLAGTTTTITANDRLCWVVAGTWTGSTGYGTITVWAHP